MNIVRRFALARMSGLFRWLTGFLLLLPFLFVYSGAYSGPAEPVMLGTAALLVVTYALVYLWYRPTRFELSDKGLTIVWPLRRRVISGDKLVRATVLDLTELRSRYGIGMRIGAGGLWGAFGLLQTTKGGMLNMYISRYDQFVVVELDGERDLLISPDRPRTFVADISAMN